MTSIALSPVIAFVVSASGVWLTKTMAYRYGWVARPKKDRWHKKPVALYGGVGMFLAFFATVVVLLANDISRNAFEVMCALLAGASLVFVTGLIDDLKNLRPMPKLVVEIVAASIPIFCGLVLKLTPWYLVNVMATYFWFIGIVNAINMLDNMDGLSSGIVMISTITILAIVGMNQSYTYDAVFLHIALAFFFSVLGFWIFNRYPATIFMGDSGSLFLGYVLAFLAIPSKLNGYMGISSSVLTLLLPVAILAVPIFDTFIVTMVRKNYGRRASQGGRDHSSHRLVGLGFSEPKAVNILYGLGIVGGMVAWLLSRWPEYATFCLSIYIIFLGLCGVYLSKVKVYAEPTDAEIRGHWTPIISELLYKRNAAEIMLDSIIVASSYYLAYLLRFESATALSANAGKYVQSLPMVVASCIVSFYVCRIYEGLWEFISVNDIMRFLKSTIMGTLAAVVIITLVYRFQGYSRTVFVIFNTLLFVSMAGSRLFFRFIDNLLAKHRADQGKLVLIYGAGEGGKVLYEEIMRNPLFRDYRVVGFIDDDRKKHNRAIAGIRIRGIHSLKREDEQIDEVWLSSDMIDDSAIRKVREQLGNRVEVKRFNLTLEQVDL
jgi:UDP-GlcNAc:undecaprenyl-phosphate GlcNAc-1-phosphate transferase